MKQSEKFYKRIVIKIGGSLFLSPQSIVNIISEISDLIRQKKELVLVSSGAIACGLSLLGLESKPKEIPHLQAIAALGQNELMNFYRRELAKKDLKCGQILLTWDDFNLRKRYLNAKNTITRLLKLGAIPIINENDTVSTDEIKFGDNDKLSALVAHLIEADLLIMLSDIEGLLTKEKKDVIRVVEEITPQIRSLACTTNKKICVGGMISKLEAAQMAVDSGLTCVIANGFKKGIVLSILESPEQAGTLFLSKKERLAAKKRWIAFGTKAKGKICVDRGAKEALIGNNKSLLSPGVLQVEGDFNSGDTVSIIDESNIEFGRGKVNYPAGELKEIKGKRSKKEVIHRDNLVII